MPLRGALGLEKRGRNSRAGVQDWRTGKTAQVDRPKSAAKGGLWMGALKRRTSASCFRGSLKSSRETYLPVTIRGETINTTKVTCCLGKEKGEKGINLLQPSEKSRKEGRATGQAIHPTISIYPHANLHRGESLKAYPGGLLETRGRIADQCEVTEKITPPNSG